MLVTVSATMVWAYRTSMLLHTVGKNLVERDNLEDQKVDGNPKTSLNTLLIRSVL